MDWLLGGLYLNWSLDGTTGNEVNMMSEASSVCGLRSLELISRGIDSARSSHRIFLA